MPLKFEDLKGLTLTGAENIDNEIVRFTSDDGRVFELYHGQDCCETVTVEEVIGDLSDLVGSPLLEAEEVSNADGPRPEYAESYTWTFYKLGTIKGHVNIRWLGQSNGYYSESVDFREANR